VTPIPDPPIPDNMSGIGNMFPIPDKKPKACFLYRTFPIPAMIHIPDKIPIPDKMRFPIPDKALSGIGGLVFTGRPV
jgi:hypothetical protein